MCNEPGKIGKLIVVKREEKGLTQEKLAEQLGVTVKTVSKWEAQRSNGRDKLLEWNAE